MLAYQTGFCSIADIKWSKISQALFVNRSKVRCINDGAIRQKISAQEFSLHSVQTSYRLTSPHAGI